MQVFLGVDILSVILSISLDPRVLKPRLIKFQNIKNRFKYATIDQYKKGRKGQNLKFVKNIKKIMIKGADS